MVSNIRIAGAIIFTMAMVIFWTLGMVMIYQLHKEAPRKDDVIIWITWGGIGILLPLIAYTWCLQI
jgi:hypothetical protein